MDELLLKNTRSTIIKALLSAEQGCSGQNTSLKTFSLVQAAATKVEVLHDYFPEMIIQPSYLEWAKRILRKVTNSGLRVDDQYLSFSCMAACHYLLEAVAFPTDFTEHHNKLLKLKRL